MQDKTWEYAEAQAHTRTNTRLLFRLLRLMVYRCVVWADCCWLCWLFYYSVRDRCLRRSMFLEALAHELGLKDVDEIVKFISILKTFNWIMFFLIFLFDVWINLQFPVLYLIVYETHDHYMYKVNYNSFIIVSAGR